jgi:quinol monooxygenase YgiN
MVTLAKIKADSAQLRSYIEFLKDEIDTCMHVQKGVLFLYAVAEQKPTHITILEIYSNADAYQSHIITPHFLKYKAATKIWSKCFRFSNQIRSFLE